MASMDPVTTAVWLLLIAPAAGAVILAILARTGRASDAHPATTPVSLVTLTVTIAALVVTLVGGQVLGMPGRNVIGLGPLDPAEPLAGIAWSAAPSLLALLFLAIAVRARSRFLIALALVQAAVALLATAVETLAPEAHATTPNALVLDPLAGLLLAVSSVVGGLIVLFAVGYEPAHLAHRRIALARTPTFLAWLLVFLSAMHLLVLADDLRILAVGWELTTLCSFVLIGFDGDREAVVAARRALAYNLGGGVALGAALLLAGPGASLSTLIAGALGGAAEGAIAPALLPLILGGFVLAAATKSALTPFHPWLLGAMVAAAPVSALLHASTMVKAGSYLLLRLSPAIAVEGFLGPAVTFLGGFAFATAALLALREHDLKRVLAFSTISSLGLIAAAAGLGTPAALAAGALLLAFHALAKALAFLVVGSLEQLSGTRDLEALVGAARRRPGVAGLLLIAAGALTLPPFGIVVAKWALLVLGASDLVLVVLLAVGGAAGLALWTAVAMRLLVRRVEGPRPELSGILPRSQGAAMAVLGVATVAGLILAAPVARLVADPAAEVAFGREAGLAAGWSVVLAGAGFAVPAIGLLILVAVGLAALVARRIPAVAPQPYLAGANVAPGASTAFHGAKGQPVSAAGAGFYWGADGDALGAGGRPVGIRRWALLGGWLGVALVVVAALQATWVVRATGGIAP